MWCELARRHILDRIRVGSRATVVAVVNNYDRGQLGDRRSHVVVISVVQNTGTESQPITPDFEVFTERTLRQIEDLNRCLAYHRKRNKRGIIN